jgi:anti-anti-sigma factor
MVFRVDDTVDVHRAVKLRADLDAVGNVPNDNLLVDLSRVPMLDSAGVGALAAARARFTGEGRRFALAGPQESVQKVLRLTGASRIFEVHPTVEDGFAALAA